MKKKKNEIIKSLSYKMLTEAVTEAVKEEMPEFNKNEGDIAEGLFAIALALYIAYGKIDDKFKAKFTQLQKSVDPSQRFSKQVVAIKMGGDPDHFIVKLTLRLKSVKTTGMSFGKWMQEVPSISKKTNAIFAQLADKEAVKKIMKMRDEILNNTKKEVVEFHVIADGVAGEGSGGKLKGDVKLTIKASEGTEEELKDADLDPVEEIDWSLKSDSKTVSNRGVLKSLSEIAEAWNFSGFKGKMKGYQGAVKKQGLSPKLVRQMFRDFGDELMATDDSPEFTKKAYQFINHNTYGEDKVDIIDVKANKVIEITKDRLDQIRDDKGTLTVEEGTQDNGDPIFYFLNVPEGEKSDYDRDRVFQLRTKIRPGKEYKMMVELGSAVFVPPSEKEPEQQKEHLTTTPLSYNMLTEMIENLMSEE